MRQETSWTQVLCIKLIHNAKGLSSSCPSLSIPPPPLLLSPFKQHHTFHRPQRRCTRLHALLLLCHILISPSLALSPSCYWYGSVTLHPCVSLFLFFATSSNNVKCPFSLKRNAPSSSAPTGKRHPPLLGYLSRT